MNDFSGNYFIDNGDGIPVTDDDEEPGLGAHPDNPRWDDPGDDAPDG